MYNIIHSKGSKKHYYSFYSITISNWSKVSVRHAYCAVTGEIAKRGENVFTLIVLPSGMRNSFCSTKSPVYTTAFIRKGSMLLFTQAVINLNRG